MSITTSREDFQPLATPAEMNPAPCRLCGAYPELWEQGTDDGNTLKAFCCPTHDPDDPLNFDEQCPMFMPPESFWQATKRQAFATWQRWHNHLLGVPNDGGRFQVARKTT